MSSGYPPQEQLFNGSLCHTGAVGTLGDELNRMAVGYGRRSRSFKNVEIATPVAVPEAAESVRAYPVPCVCALCAAL